MKIRQLGTTGAVIDECGGTVATAAIIRRTKQHVSNYRRTGRFPPDTFLVLKDELKKRRCAAPSSLWGIPEPVRASSAA